MIAKKKVKSTSVPVATTAEDIYYEPGQNVQLIFHEEHTHLFDIISGDRIRS